MKFMLERLVRDDDHAYWKQMGHVEEDHVRGRDERVRKDPETKQEELDLYVGKDLPKVSLAGRKLIGAADGRNIPPEQWEETWETGGPQPRWLDGEIKSTLKGLAAEKIEGAAEKLDNWGTIALMDSCKANPIVKTVWYRVHGLARSLARLRELKACKKDGTTSWWTGKTGFEQERGLDTDEKAMEFYRADLVTRQVLNA